MSGVIAATLCSKDAESLVGKRIGMFSYGSGLASTMFSLQIADDIRVVEPFIGGLKDVLPRLESRIAIPPAQFAEILKLKEETHHLGKVSQTISSITVFKLIFRVK